MARLMHADDYSAAEADWQDHAAAEAEGRPCPVGPVCFHCR